MVLTAHCGSGRSQGVVLEDHDPGDEIEALFLEAGHHGLHVLEQYGFLSAGLLGQGDVHLEGDKPLITLDVDDQGVHVIHFNGFLGRFPYFLAGQPVGGEIQRLHLEGGEGDLGGGSGQLRGGQLPPGITRVAQLEGLPGALQVEDAVLVGPHLLIAQGDQGAGDGRLGLGVNHLAVIAFGGDGRGRLGLPFSGLALWSRNCAGDGGFGLRFGGLGSHGRAGTGNGFLGLALDGLAASGAGAGAGDGFLGLASTVLGSDGQRRAGQNQGPHQDEHGHTEFLLHACPFRPAALPARRSSGCTDSRGFAPLLPQKPNTLSDSDRPYF